MAKTIFSDRNYTPAATLAGGSYEATLPLSNAQDRPFSRVARTTDATAASTLFTVDLTEVKTTQLLSLIGHNIVQASATIRFRASNDAGATTNLIYDSGLLVVLPSVYDWLTHDFYEPNWFYGEPYSEDLELFTKQFIHIPPDPIKARYWRIDVADSSNADVYVQFGFFYQANIFRPSVDIKLNHNLSFIDNTGIQEAISGVEYFDNREKPRIIVVSIKGLPKDEMLSNLFLTARRQGKGGLIYIVPDEDDNLNLSKESFLGRLTEMPAFRDFVDNFYETEIALKEII